MHDRGSQRYVKSGSVTTEAPHQGLMQKHRKQSRRRWHHILLPRYLYDCLMTGVRHLPIRAIHGCSGYE